MKKLDKTGNHIHMSPEEIANRSATITDEHETYLKKYGVTLPRTGSLPFLWLVYLRKYKGQLVHKDTISSFIATIDATAGKDQQIRHLAEKGRYVLNKGEKLLNEDAIVPSGYHTLVTTESPKPSFLYKSLKRAGRMGARSFDDLKAVYDFRCVTCGSQEGKPHLLESDKRTSLQQGHMNPLKPLALANTIPQCQVCNQVYQDRYVFNEKGRAIAVASVDPVRNADAPVKKLIRAYLDSDPSAR